MDAAALALGGYVSSTGSTVAQSDSALTAIALGFSLVPAVLVAVSLLSLRAYRLPSPDRGDAEHGGAGSQASDAFTSNPGGTDG